MRKPCDTCVDFRNCRSDDLYHRYVGSGTDCWRPKPEAEKKVYKDCEVTLNDDVYFDPAYTIDKDGHIRIVEISLVRKPEKTKES